MSKLDGLFPYLPLSSLKKLFSCIKLGNKSPFIQTTKSEEIVGFQFQCFFSFQGTYADYLELVKLFDKNSNGTMMLAELDNILSNLGDEVPKEEVQKLFAELADPEDEVD